MSITLGPMPELSALSIRFDPLTQSLEKSLMLFHPEGLELIAHETFAPAAAPSPAAILKSIRSMILKSKKLKPELLYLDQSLDQPAFIDELLKEEALTIAIAPSDAFPASFIELLKDTCFGGAQDYALVNLSHEHHWLYWKGPKSVLDWSVPICPANPEITQLMGKPSSKNPAPPAPAQIRAMVKSIKSEGGILGFLKKAKPSERRPLWLAWNTLMIAQEAESRLPQKGSSLKGIALSGSGAEDPVLVEWIQQAFPDIPVHGVDVFNLDPRSILTQAGAARAFLCALGRGSDPKVRLLPGKNWWRFLYKLNDFQFDDEDQ